jgi:hypothetical protein
VPVRLLFLASNSVRIDLLIAEQATALGYPLKKHLCFRNFNSSEDWYIHGQESFDFGRG